MQRRQVRAGKRSGKKLKQFTFLILVLILTTHFATSNLVSALKITPEWTYKINSAVYAIRVSPNGEYVVVGAKNGRIYYFNWNGKLTWDYLTGGFIASLDITKDGSHIVVAVGYDSNRDGIPEYGKIIYMTTEKHVIWTYKSPKNEFFSSVSAGDRDIYVGGEGTLIKFSYSGSRVSTNLVNIALAEVDTSGNYVSISHSPWFYKKGDTTYNKLLLFSGTFLKSIREFDDAVVGTAISREYYVAITGLHLTDKGKWHGSGSYYVYLFKNTGELLWRYKLEAPAFDVDITPNGNLIAVGDRGGNVYIIDREGILIWKYTMGSPVYAVSLSKEGDYLAVGTKDGRVALFQVPGMVQVTSNPEGAKIYINENGEYYEIGETPRNFVLPPGTYEFKIVKEYYHPAIIQVEVRPGTVLRENVGLQLANGTINVYSNVKGSQVYIDNIPVGKTPLNDYLIPAGNHTVTVRAEGYCGEYSENVSITSPQPISITAKLKPCPATLRIDGTKGAKVYIDGKYQGMIPLTTQLSPGRHSIFATKDDKKDYRLTLSLSPGERRTLTINMKINPVYYGIRMAILFSLFFVIVLFLRAYRRYQFRKSYTEIIKIIDSARIKGIPDDATDLLAELDSLKNQAKEAYKKGDRDKLWNIKQEVTKKLGEINRITNEYISLKKKIVEDITNIINQFSRESPRKEG